MLKGEEQQSFPLHIWVVMMKHALFLYIILHLLHEQQELQGASLFTLTKHFLLKEF